MNGISFFKADQVRTDSMLSKMAIDITVNERGDMLVMHGDAFSPALKHIEFHAGDGELYFVDTEDNYIPFGMPIPPQTCAKMACAKDANLARMDKAPAGHKNLGGFVIGDFTTIRVLQIPEART